MEIFFSPTDRIQKICFWQRESFNSTIGISKEANGQSEWLDECAVQQRPLQRMNNYAMNTVSVSRETYNNEHDARGKRLSHYTKSTRQEIRRSLRRNSGQTIG